MATSSSTQFTGLFGSAPAPIRDFLHSALQLRDLQDLYTRARGTSHATLSRAVLDLLNIRIQLPPHHLQRFPRTGAVVVVANHPFGLLDGLVLDAVLHELRRDVKILTNAFLWGMEELRDRCLPVDVFGGPDGASTNMRSARQAFQLLSKGHCIAMFPAGEVAHWHTGKGSITDPAWNESAARFAMRTGASVVPIYFGGANSLAFQIAGLLHPKLRTARLAGELLNKRGSQVEVRIGTAIQTAELAKQGSLDRATQYLRARTYVLSHHQTTRQNIRPPVRAEAPRRTVAPFQTIELSAEISRLEREGHVVVENESYTVFRERGSAIPALMRETGRAREITFRAAGEGTGKDLDLDAFDEHYTHLLLWHKASGRVAGSYRLAWTQDVLPASGVRGLYTSTLFRFAPAFFRALGPAVELGRSFISPEFQKDYAPLLLLWQAIGRSVAARPDAPVLFGPVSISADYSEASRQLIVEFLRKRRFRADLAHWVSPRRPFRSRLMRATELRAVAACLGEVEDLSARINDIDEHSGVPVLLRQYLRLGGRVAAFHVDRNFSDTLDGLLIVDLRETPEKMLAKYVGPVKFRLAATIP
jgi:putative hemolysin